MATPVASTVTPADVYKYHALRIAPKNDGLGDAATQKKNPSGVLLWTVDAIREGGESDEDVTISVTVPAPTKPNIDRFAAVAFTNLRAGFWLMQPRASGGPARGGLFWQADAVAAASASRRSE